MTARHWPRWSSWRPCYVRGAALNSTERRWPGAASIPDLRLLARRRAPRAVFDYADGAAGEEVSLRRLPAGVREGRVQPNGSAGRFRRGHVDDDPREAAAAPIVFAPTGFTRMVHTEGEPAVARVAARMASRTHCPPWGPRPSSGSRTQPLADASGFSSICGATGRRAETSSQGLGSRLRGPRTHRRHARHRSTSARCA
jgi:hypothetical protein